MLLLVGALVVTGLQVVFATVPNPGHLLSQLECNSLFCINTSTGEVTIGGTTVIPLIVNGRIKSTGTPTDATDVATKGYVDSLGRGGTNTVVEFTASGQWTVPANIEFINVILIGGGGAGGLANLNEASGGGGGSGSIDNIQLTVTPSEVLNIVVGAAGTPSSKNGGSSYLTKADGKLLFWVSGGGGGGDGDFYGGQGGLGRCPGGNGHPVCSGCSSVCSGQCGGGACGSYGGPGYGGTGYGAGGGGGGCGDCGIYKGGGGGGGYYGVVTTPVSASNGSGTTGGAGAPGIVIIAY